MWQQAAVRGMLVSPECNGPFPEVLYLLNARVTSAPAQLGVVIEAVLSALCVMQGNARNC